METEIFCDCIYFDGQFWQQECECRNSGNLVDAQRCVDELNKKLADPNWQGMEVK